MPRQVLCPCPQHSAWKIRAGTSRALSQGHLRCIRVPMLRRTLGWRIGWSAMTSNSHVALAFTTPSQGLRRPSHHPCSQGTRELTDTGAADAGLRLRAGRIAGQVGCTQKPVCCCSEQRMQHRHRSTTAANIRQHPHCNACMPGAPNSSIGCR